MPDDKPEDDVPLDADEEPKKTSAPAKPTPEGIPEEGDADYDPSQEWLVMQSRTQGRPYYYHTKTKQTVWDKPPDFDEDLGEGEDGWHEMESRTQGRHYYYNQRTRECTWERPPGVPEPMPFERRRPNPKRDALRQIINDWADEFHKANGREPTEEDIPQGSDIARHHRDYRMLKQEEEVERLKKEQARLRQELSPDSRERLIKIKEELGKLEGKVNEWRKTKDEERARREKVTTTYNAWIKSFTEEHGRAPMEKDIDPGSDIAQMFKEYSVYREEARRAKARQQRIEAAQRRAKHEEDQQKIRHYMSEFEKKHGRWPSQKDLPKGSDIEKLYQDYLDAEMELNPDSPRAKREQLRRQIGQWSAEFEREHGRKPTKKDIPAGSAVAELYGQYDALSERKRDQKHADPARARQGKGKTARAPRGDDGGGEWEEMQALHGGSPRSYSQYQRNKGGKTGCADCCTQM
eukprot:TRINITY_DN16827_c0_g2_i1.p1 TRINITY_DN16827_c0_g2~~TRINITY_DN16827_c0_g2_i1.p1  ORF type:complete len:464 (+),score=179.44 TRINITY_DN16827_c0_g2_i1:152-1543(+)